MPSQRSATDPFPAALAALRADRGRQERQMLSSKCVRLRMLDQHGKPVRDGDRPDAGVKVASGFLRREHHGLFLYTCWHVVTGIQNFGNPTLPGASQRVMSLAVDTMNAEPERDAANGGRELEGIGGTRTTVLALYDRTVEPARPLWEQERSSRSAPAIEVAGLKAPKFHDVVRIRMDDEQQFFSSLQVFEPANTWRDVVAPGDQLLVAGYPYGFSPNMEHMESVLLTRHAADLAIGGRVDGPFLDSPCAPGMSGGPVVIGAGGHVFLVGVYTGARYPDGPKESPDRWTALGTYCPLVTLLCGPEDEFVTYGACE